MPVPLRFRQHGKGDASRACTAMRDACKYLIHDVLYFMILVMRVRVVHRCERAVDTQAIIQPKPTPWSALRLAINYACGTIYTACCMLPRTALLSLPSATIAGNDHSLRTYTFVLSAAYINAPKSRNQRYLAAVCGRCQCVALGSCAIRMSTNPVNPVVYGTVPESFEHLHHLNRL